ncbi:extracellular solute-binding protein, partial [Clostridioides difficile]|uniref:extracellular solute-binding protein n=1 Tax=Clostridioides difficile TaxID=1496 RepID=UPI00235A41ED
FSKMTTAFAGDVAPDIFFYTLDDVPVRAANNTIANLTPFIERDKYDLSDLYETDVGFGSYDGQQYALPASSTSRMLFYNLDLLEAAGLTEADVPKTWDELYEVAHKMDIVEDGVI